MGFSCYACSEAFEETVPPPNSRKGAGDGHAEVKGRPVSAISKCGHLFHTDCLKKALEKQSGNAWVAKSCPVCQHVLTMNDLIRVHANPFDSRSTQRVRIEELMMQNRKLHEKYENEKRTSDMMRSQLRDQNLEIEGMRQREQDLILQRDHVNQLNHMQKAEIERVNAEKDKLKNIIISLTEKFACNEVQIPVEYYGSGILPNMNTGNGNVVRLEYTDELKKMPVGDSNSGILIGIKHPAHHHPPGFFPQMSIPMENRSDYQDSDRGSQTPSISPDNFKPHNGGNGNSMLAPGKGKPGMHNILPMENPHQGRITSFALHDVQVRDYDTNNNSAGTRNVMEELSTQMVNDFALKETANGSSTCSPYSSQNGSLINSTNGQSQNGISGTASTDNVTNGIDEELAEVENPVDKWYEKKSRRRGSSNSSGGAGKGGRKSGKLEAFEKKLMYGLFACPTCKAKWGSSQSILDTPQTCRYCNTVVHPYSQGPILSRKQLEFNKQTSNNNSSVTGTINKKK